MDQTGNQKQQSLSQFMKSQFHRKLTKLLLSVSVFSLFFSRSYWLSLLHSFTSNYHNTLPFQLFSHTIDKNCIFLLCNGLLVFLSKYSGLDISSSSKNNTLSDDDQSFKSYEYVPKSESIALDPKASLLEKEVALESTVDEVLKSSIVTLGWQEEEEVLAATERETENFTLEEEEDDDDDEDREKWGLMSSGEEEEEEEDEEEIEGSDDGSFVEEFGESENYEREEEEEEEEEIEGSDDGSFVEEFGESENYEREEEEEEEIIVEGNRVLSTEELNKRFDEFIRKMKEELRIEARQQLIMV